MVGSVSQPLARLFMYPHLSSPPRGCREKKKKDGTRLVMYLPPLRFSHRKSNEPSLINGSPHLPKPVPLAPSPCALILEPPTVVVVQAR